MSNFESYHSDLIEDEAARYKKGEEVHGEMVGGDSPDKKLEGEEDKNKEEKNKQKTFAHISNEVEMQESKHDKNKALELVNASNDSPWPPISFEGKKEGGIEGGSSSESLSA